MLVEVCNKMSRGVGEQAVSRSTHVKNIQTAFILGLSLILGACSTAPIKPAALGQGDYSYAIEYLNWMINESMRKHDVKGLSIALVDDQRVVWSKGFGYADAELQQAATPDTVYRIGSISKLFTAFEIMRLVERGKLDLDAPITRYLPQFAIENRFTNSEPITIRSLLSHHSGLPTDYLYGMWIEQPVSLDQLISNLKMESLASPPQSMYRYSNIGYSILGRVIEVVSQDQYTNVMQQDLLNTLKMSDSSFLLNARIEPLFSKGYRDGKPVLVPTLRDVPAGSMLSNVKDLARYLSVIFADGQLDGQQILQPEILGEMFRNQYPEREFDFEHRVGLAWMLSGLNVDIDRRVAWHNGGYTPFQAHLSLLPDDDLGIVILSNTDSASSFITQVGTKALALAREAKYGKLVAEKSPQTSVDTTELPRNKLEEYAGRYVVFSNVTPFNINGHGLDVDLMGNTFNLIPVSESQFLPTVSTLFGLISIPLHNLSLQFKSIHGVQLALLEGLPAPIAFQKIDSYPIPQAWMDRLGEYEVSNGYKELEFKKFVLKVEAGVLLADVSLASSYRPQTNADLKVALKPISDSEAVVMGLGNGEGGLVKILKEDNKQLIYYSGFHFKPRPSVVQ